MDINKWEIFEASFEYNHAGDPFADVTLSARFTRGNRTVSADGFYDGGGVYKLRFMPDHEGLWRYETISNAPELNGLSGEFNCAAARADVHGPVVTDGTRFVYADGSDYYPFGTTCYAWSHQGDELEELTLETLKAAPFNKLRMCVFPKRYDFNHNEPPRYPFAGNKKDGFDYSRPDPDYFKHLELRISQLKDLGIEADLILFHPYDDWGFSTMPRERDLGYLRYVVARLASFRNVWWSFANEYDLMTSKTTPDWDEFFKLVSAADPSGHLRSIHNCRAFYDHSKSWVTHCSIQHSDLFRVPDWIKQYGKPVVVDECCYEGDIHHLWGNITAKEMVNRMWIGFSRGAYAGHGETYMADNDVLWWSKGAVLRGESPRRIAFMRAIFESIPGRTEPASGDHGEHSGLRAGEDYYLLYYDDRQQRIKKLIFPEDKKYRIDVIDAWECAVTRLGGTYGGRCEIPMPGKPYQALRATRI